MRITSLLAGAALMAFATTATAAPLSPISYSPEFQASLEDEYGVREGEVLQRDVERAIDRALAARGVSNGNIGIDVAILDADPNRPTMQQLAAEPSLDPIRSISIGGAELHATLRAADGRALEEISHRRYSLSIDEISPAQGTWSDARRAIRQFANKVADAYVAQAR